jgi:nucleoside-diphosphate-sugar epimerase
MKEQSKVLVTGATGKVGVHRTVGTPRRLSPSLMAADTLVID